MRKTLLTIGAVAAPRAALACPVCFGDANSPLAIATNMGIIAMLVVVAGMIGAFATFFIYLNRRATRVKAFPSESDAGVVVVRVVAHQFAWEIQYPGPDGKFGRTDPKLVTAENNIGIDRTDPNAKDDIVTTNQLMLPVDRPVLVHLS